MSNLALSWVLIIGFSILMYVVLDGFTLGIGILLPFLDKQERNIAMSVVLPNWDGNQTWLVMGGAALYGAFPLAFSTILPILYLPLTLMVLALLFRGVAFEFHLKTKRGRRLWDGAFMFGSLSATLIQGIMLGAFVQGFDRISPNATLPWLTPFSLFTGIALVCGYTLLGASRLIIKTENELQVKMYRFARTSAFLVSLCLIIASVWTCFVHPTAFKHWFAQDRLWFIILLPLTAIILLFGLFTALAKQRERQPYWLSIGIFICSYAGFIISVWPTIVPYSITIEQAAAPAGSLTFMLIGAGIMLPVLLFYTWYSYHIFRGKITETISY